MNGLTVTPTQVVAGVGVLLVLFWAWRAGARRAKAAAEKARSGARLVSLAGRVVFNAALIVAVQWVVIARQGGTWVLLAVLGLPALFAAHALTRALTVTTVDTSKRGGRR
ncbi:hypothetical protein ACWEHA_01065 [Amycolatopsis nivea]